MSCKIKRQVPNGIRKKGTGKIICPVASWLLIACLIKVCKMFVHQKRAVSGKLHVRMDAKHKKPCQDQKRKDPVQPAQLICFPNLHTVPLVFFSLQIARSVFCFFLIHVSSPSLLPDPVPFQKALPHQNSAALLPQQEGGPELWY